MRAHCFGTTCTLGSSLACPTYSSQEDICPWRNTLQPRAVPRLLIRGVIHYTQWRSYKHLHQKVSHTVKGGANATNGGVTNYSKLRGHTYFSCKSNPSVSGGEVIPCIFKIYFASSYEKIDTYVERETS